MSIGDLIKQSINKRLSYNDWCLIALFLLMYIISFLIDKQANPIKISANWHMSKIFFSEKRGTRSNKK